MAFIKVNMDFIDNFSKTFSEIDENVMDWLEESGQIVEDSVRNHTVMASGFTRDSWRHEVKKESDGVAVCEVKSDYPNASFEEFGTGDGPTEVGHYPGFKGKVPWKYYSHNFGAFFTTSGKPARHPAKNGFEEAKPIIEALAQRIL